MPNQNSPSLTSPKPSLYSSQVRWKSTEPLNLRRIKDSKFVETLDLSRCLFHTRKSQKEREKEIFGDLNIGWSVKYTFTIGDLRPPNILNNNMKKEGIYWSVTMPPGTLGTASTFKENSVHLPSLYTYPGLSFQIHSTPHFLMT